jgi:hypothetical protein
VIRGGADRRLECRHRQGLRRAHALDIGR